MGGQLRIGMAVYAGGGNSASASVALLLIFAIGMVANHDAGKLRKHAACLLVPCSLVIILVASRGAIAAVVLVLFVSFMFMKRKGAVAIVLILGVIAVGIISKYLFPNLFEAIGSRMSIAGHASRSDAFSEAISLIRQNPVFGVGVGQFFFAGENFFQHAHNDFLNIGAEHGIVGLVLVISTGLAIVSCVIKKWRSSIGITKAVLFATIIALAVYVIEMQVYIMYWEKAGMLMAGLAGLAFSMPRYLDNPELVLYADNSLLEDDRV